MTEDIFDLTNLSDLPEEIQAFATVKERKKKADEFAEQISKLFAIAKRPLTLSEMIVGLYRQFNVKIGRKALMMKFFYLSRVKNSDIKQINTLQYVHKSALTHKEFDAIKAHIHTRKKK